MRFPFILRNDHDEIVRLLNLQICSLEDTVRQKDYVIETEHKEIESLMEQLTTPDEVVAHKERKKLQTVLRGRSGWRANARSRAIDTIKAPPDSSKALQEKVLKEGGTI